MGPEELVAFVLVIDSGLTLLDPSGGLWYRGWEAAEASRSAWFEHVALWLWGRYSPTIDEGRYLFEAPTDLLDQASRAVALTSERATPLDRYLLALAAAAEADPYRHGRDPYGVGNRGARMIAVLVESLPITTRTAPPRPIRGRPRPLAERLWYRLAPRRPSAQQVPRSMLPWSCWPTMSWRPPRSPRGWPPPPGPTSTGS